VFRPEFFTVPPAASCRIATSDFGSLVRRINAADTRFCPVNSAGNCRRAGMACPLRLLGPFGTVFVKHPAGTHVVNSALFYGKTLGLRAFGE
jgi:hypothetical protein